MFKLPINEVPVKIKNHGFGRYSVRIEYYTENYRKINYHYFPSKGKAMLYFNKKRKENFDRVSLFNNDELWMEENINGNLVDFLA